MYPVLESGVNDGIPVSWLRPLPDIPWALASVVPAQEEGLRIHCVRPVQRGGMAEAVYRHVERTASLL